MGRAENRLRERQNRISERKNKVLVSRRELSEMKRRTEDDMSAYAVEVMMACFGLAEHRLYGFGKDRIVRTMKAVDDMLGAVADGEITMQDIENELYEEARVRIKME